MKKTYGLLATLGISLILTACGGGSSSGSSSEDKLLAVTQTERSVLLGTDVVELSARNSQFPSSGSGNPIYSWTLNEKPAESAGYLTDKDKETAKLNVDVIGEYKLKLVVGYDNETSEPVDIVVTVREENAAPTAVIEDLTVELGQQVVLDGSASSDPEGETLQYRWKWAYSAVKPSGVPVPELSGANTSVLTFTPQAVATYNLTFFVFDGERISEEKEVTITVEKPANGNTNAAPIGELIATGYYPSYSIGEQELGLRAEFNFEGYDPEGDELQVVEAVLTEKPADSAAELVDIGSWKPLGKKIQKLDVVGTYRVRMTLTDGTNQITREANMEAKIGNVNGQPSTRSVDAVAKSVIVGNALIFDASSKDPNNDEMTFMWELVDKPDDSNASIEPVIESESGEFRRAKVVTDVPGSYTARLIVRDDRGLYAKTYSEDTGFAKTFNTAPEIRSVVWTRNWGRLDMGEDFFQILPCMSLLHRPVLIDADGDEVAYHEELTSAPDGGEFTSYPDETDCPDSRGTVFSKPGQYVFTYYATDLIDDAPNYEFVVNVDPIEEAKGVRLRSINSDNESLWHPMPYENIPPYASDFSASLDPFEEEYVQWSLTAADADYTIENLMVKHINGDVATLQPRLEGLSEGLVIAKGESVDFKTITPAIPCVRTGDRSEGFHYSFNIKEIPELTFTYEVWQTASDGMFSEWEECETGEID